VVRSGYPTVENKHRTEEVLSLRVMQLVMSEAMSLWACFGREVA